MSRLELVSRPFETKFEWVRGEVVLEIVARWEFIDGGLIWKEDGVEERGMITVWFRVPEDSIRFDPVEDFVAEVANVGGARGVVLDQILRFVKDTFESGAETI